MEGEYNIHRWLPVLCSALGLPVMKEGTQVCHGRGDTAFPALLPRAYPVQARPDMDEGVHLLLPSSPMPGMPGEASHGRGGTASPACHSMARPE